MKPNVTPGVVTSVREFGAFVSLEPGIEGLIPISKLGAGKKLENAAEVLKESDSVDVYIDRIDHERRRISLSLENPQIGAHRRRRWKGVQGWRVRRRRNRCY